MLILDLNFITNSNFNNLSGLEEWEESNLNVYFP